MNIQEASAANSTTYIYAAPRRVIRGNAMDANSPTACIAMPSAAIIWTIYDRLIFAFDKENFQPLCRFSVDCIE